LNDNREEQRHGATEIAIPPIKRLFRVIDPSQPGHPAFGDDRAI